MSMLLTAVPAAIAQMGPSSGWQASNQHQNAEPNVQGWDTQTDYMHAGPNQADADKIYFDGQADTWFLPGVPHPSADQAQPGTFAFTSLKAMLGFWRDCNTDGFVGSAALGTTYDVNAPDVDTSICPAGSPYNNGQQVNEFLPIGPNTRDTGQDGTLCPSTTGEADNQPRPEDGQAVAEGGDNVACLGGNTAFVQDDWATVWSDLTLPTAPSSTTSLLFPFPDGTYRDTNGHFRFVDSLTFGTTSQTAPNLWPTQPGQDKSADPAIGTQCEAGAEDGVYNAGGENGAPATVIATNAQEGASNSCSSIPNVKAFSFPAPVGDVAYPAHLIERSYNNSEDPNNDARPIVAPYDRDPNEQNDDPDADRCHLEANPDNWDEDDGDRTDQDGARDGDPFYGGSPTDTAFYQQFYSPGYGDKNGEGVSVVGTVDNINRGVSYQAAVAQSQNGEESTNCGTGTAFPYNNLEVHGAGGSQAENLKIDSDDDYGYIQDSSFNPATAPGGSDTDDTAADRDVCAPVFVVASQGQGRCSGFWSGEFIYVNTHGATTLDPTVASGQQAVYYADVSFGNTDGFDPEGDGTFDTAVDNKEGYWQAPAGLDTNPANVLPAGEDDAHTYGDEQCASYTQLSGDNNNGNDISTATFNDDLQEVASEWNCDRNPWIDLADISCPEGPEKELACWSIGIVGDPYDLRDVDCLDNDVAGQSTTDESGPLAMDTPVNQDPSEEGPVGPLNADNPNGDCDQPTYPDPAPQKS